MARIVPKLNLNKTPSIVENNSLIFAKNIRLDVDNTIHRDYGISPMTLVKDKIDDFYVHYGNILTKIYFDLPNDDVRKQDVENVVKHGTFSILGIVPYNTEFYLFIRGTYTIVSADNKEIKYTKDFIFCYDEKTNKFASCKCNWSYGGGTISGYLINNLKGDKILNIAESGTYNLVPFKSINLNKSKIDDDESIYTQTPKIPLTNLEYAKSFSYTIPNGVYQFFVRYKIRDNFYTNWFPASIELFAGNTNNVVTSYGSLKYVNINRDSDNSFTLKVEHLLKDNTKSYKNFQIGFILSHDDAIYARAWKHFNFDINYIDFDYKPTDAEEIEVFELTKPTYCLYNVGNVTSFKNRLYISNYTETNFNENLQGFADKINISIQTQKGGDTFNDKPITGATVDINGKKVIKGIKNDDGTFTYFSGANGIIAKSSTKLNNDSFGLLEVIRHHLYSQELEKPIDTPIVNGIQATILNESKFQATKRLEDKYKTEYKENQYKITYDFNYLNYNVVNIIAEDKEYLPATANAMDIVNYINEKPRYVTFDGQFVDDNGNLYNESTIVFTRSAIITKTTTTYNNVDPGKNPNGQPDIPPDKPMEWEDPIIATNSFEDTSELENNTNKPIIREDVFTVDFDQVIKIRYTVMSNQIGIDDTSTLLSNYTLIPYQKYKFYVHFVKENGEITNGYVCNKDKELEAPYKEKCSSIIYPKFSNIDIPSGYAACFFSICNTRNKVSTIIDIQDGPDGSGVFEGKSLDVDMSLVPGYEKIHIKQGKNDTFSGKYYYSSDTSTNRYFGADGVITFEKDGFDKGTNENPKVAYVVSDYAIAANDDLDLIKCTPFITKDNCDRENQTDSSVSPYCYANFNNMNLLGFLCTVYTLKRDVCITHYNDGQSVYRKSNEEVITDSGQSINLQELSKYNDPTLDSSRRLSYFGLKNSDKRNIYSNYNLNFVKLSEEPTFAIKTYYDRAPNASPDTSEAATSDARTIVLRLIPSQIMSNIYELPSMYKDYTRKTYLKYNENATTTFDNTVRSSVLSGDEEDINILYFDANDYYNIPTNRGIITNLIAVGDAILVHTEDSMFRFTGSTTLQSSDGEIVTTENQPFDSGVGEIFGSDFGYAGLQNKDDQIMTEKGYIFFDRDSRIIYQYSGQGQLVKISDSIEKLFRHKEISSVSFANDFYNNRFFVSINFYDYIYTKVNNEIKTSRKDYPVTLSFSFNEEIKSFVSLHDFYYYKAFNTKTKCYFLTTEGRDISIINKHEFNGCYNKLRLVSDKSYPSSSIKKNISVKKVHKGVLSNTTDNLSVEVYDSIIDIIDNRSYENIKTLNAISWSGNYIKSEFEKISEVESTTRVSEDIDTTIRLTSEEIKINVPCKYIRIYSDSCLSKQLDCDNIANNNKITSADSYKYPYYNQGMWNLNYFRNQLCTRKNSDSPIENSLIEGKYFVVRFAFNDLFKLETLELNSNIK